MDPTSRIAAGQLVATPGMARFHHSRISWNVHSTTVALAPLVADGFPGD